MAIPILTLAGDAAITPTAFAAPAASDTLFCGDGVWLWIKVLTTATTITVETPGNDAPARVPKTDLVIGPITSAERVVRIGRKWAKADGNADLTFSQLTGVSVLGIIFRPGEFQ